MFTRLNIDVHTPEHGERCSVTSRRSGLGRLSSAAGGVLGVDRMLEAEIVVGPDEKDVEMLAHLIFSADLVDGLLRSTPMALEVARRA